MRDDGPVVGSLGGGILVKLRSNLSGTAGIIFVMFIRLNCELQARKFKEKIQYHSTLKL